ncbi:hypothetical protein TNCV_1525731 [Trichonephila clavipes]|nr:hypothetical protein TNCV_1525731 [Trichonephila clavipes]
MVLNDESDTVTADLTINVTSRSAVALGGQPLPALTLKPAIFHPFMPASFNGRITSNYIMSDSTICSTCLF